MRTFLVLSLVLCGGSAPAWAQTFPNLVVTVQGFNVSMDSGDRTRVSNSSGPLAIGVETASLFGVDANNCAMSVGPANDRMVARLSSSPTHWRVLFVPIAVQDEAVTVRVKWTRDRTNGAATPDVGGEATVTLRPDDTFPLDLLPASGPGWCRPTANGIRMKVGYSTLEFDARLTTTDIWLIERLADGAERSQIITLRGVYFERTPFHFETLTDSDVSLDIFGTFILIPKGDTIEARFDIRAAVLEKGRAQTDWQDGNRFSARRLTPIVPVKTDDVAAIELPRISENNSGAFSNRTLSIRVRARQVR